MNLHRGDDGKYISIEKRIGRIIIIGVLTASVVIPIGVKAYDNYMKPEPLRSPIVDIVRAQEPKDPCANKDCIDDPLYHDVQNNLVAKYIYQVFSQISTKVAREAIEVAWGESRFHPDSKNSTSTAVGVFQILIGTWNGYKCKGERTNYVDNVNCAVKIYKSNNNWSQWQAKPVSL